MYQLGKSFFPTYKIQNHGTVRPAKTIRPDQINSRR